jgi:hypothetical protein
MQHLEVGPSVDLMAVDLHKAWGPLTKNQVSVFVTQFELTLATREPVKTLVATVEEEDLEATYFKLYELQHEVGTKRQLVAGTRTLFELVADTADEAEMDISSEKCQTSGRACARAGGETIRGHDAEPGVPACWCRFQGACIWYGGDGGWLLILRV